ncbi:MAG: hypothetical protein M0Z70_06860 [Nitrospiraceae bacterium]|nr:hypothetical protein [Nitrospiraceae bacterium]
MKQSILHKKFAYTIFFSLPLAILLFISSPAFSQPISTLWKARALEAGEKLKKLEIELKKIPAKEQEKKTPRYRKLMCGIMLEAAYAMHIAAPEVVYKTDEKHEFYHIVLSAGEDVFDLVYVYTEDGKHVATRIDRLPKKWQLIMAPFFPEGLSLLIPDGCVIVFNLKDPFLSTVEAK